MRRASVVRTQAEANVRIDRKGQIMFRLRRLSEWMRELAGRSNVCLRLKAPFQQVWLLLGRNVTLVLVANGRVHRRLRRQSLDIQTKCGQRGTGCFSVSRGILKTIEGHRRKTFLVVDTTCETG